ncbi:hypothetical protein ABGT15_10885 [Flavobacterium enshiense]|uniref:hypothetical protein n=1 Tax=Flavobacterium enshiense TaxID=1341165 RepID=UPI00345CBE09
MKKLTLITAMLLAVSAGTVMATPVKTIETVQEKPVSKASVEKQINQLMATSVDYNDVKLVKKTALEELRADFMTFISKTEANLESAKSALAQKTSQYRQLQTEHQSVKAQLKENSKGGEKITLFGIGMSKDLYHAIMWSLVLVLVIAVVFLTTRFRKANAVTQNSKGLLRDLEDEFESFKRNAIEREQKLRRQLQDEINKQKSEKKVEVS